VLDSGVSHKKNALQYLIEKLADNELIELYYGGEFLRDYISVDRVCEAMMFCIQNAPTNEIINIGNGYLVKFGDIIKFAKYILGSESYIESIDPPKFHSIVQVKDMWLDISKLNDYGWFPKEHDDIEYTVEEIVDEIKRKKKEE